MLVLGVYIHSVYSDDDSSAWRASTDDGRKVEDSGVEVEDLKGGGGGSRKNKAGKRWRQRKEVEEGDGGRVYYRHFGSISLKILHARRPIFMKRTIPINLPELYRTPLAHLSKPFHQIV